MSEAITHLAGNRIVVGQYAIQRCMLCGEKLDEFNARDIASPDGRPLAELAFGAFYEFKGNRMSLIGETQGPYFPSDLDLPDNCCIRIRGTN